VTNLIKAQREAFTQGAAHVWNLHTANKLSAYKYFYSQFQSEEVEPEAARMYSLTKPRVLRSGGLEYRVVDGVVQCRSVGTESWNSSYCSADRVTLINDLLQNPTEEVAE